MKMWINKLTTVQIGQNVQMKKKALIDNMFYKHSMANKWSLCTETFINKK